MHKWNGDEWQITKANQAKLDAEQVELERVKAIKEAQHEYDLIIIEIQTLSRMAQAGRASDAQKEKLQQLELRSFDLYNTIHDV